MALVASVLSAKIKAACVASGAFGASDPSVAASADLAATKFSDGLAAALVDILKNDLQVVSVPALTSPPGGGPVAGTIANTQL